MTRPGDEFRPSEPVDATGRAKHWDKCCPMCGKWFESTRSDAVTCSPTCRKRLQREGGLGSPKNKRRRTGRQRGVHSSALREIVRREARSEYSSIYAAPAEFAAIAREALRLK